MRVRKRKNGETRRAACGSLLLPFDKNEPVGIEPTVLFPDKTRVHLEIGCGKGAFITTLAEREPEVGFLVVEKVSDVILLAAEKARDAALENVRFLCCDAEYLPRVLPAHFAERIYLNFCDPWPKARHAKRRLTYRESLKRIAGLLAPDGIVAFKTDNRELFDFSIAEFEAAGFSLRHITYDLHASEWACDNIMTEYERNFSEKGFKINRLEAFLPQSAEFSENF